MDSPEVGRPGEQRRRRWTAWAPAFAAASLAGAGALAVILARGPIAERLAAQWLRRQGVASDLQISALSLHGLSARLRLGDPTDPDLVVDRVEVGYALTGPWSSQPFGVQTRSVRLVRPWIRLRLSGGRIQYGSLQRLIDSLSKRPRNAGPQPDVTVQDARVLIAAPQGALRLRGDAEIRTGVLRKLTGRAEPFRLALAGSILQGAGGQLTMTGGDGRMQALADLGRLTFEKAARRVEADRATLTAELPFPTGDGRWRGPMRVVVTALGASASAPGAQADGGDLSAVATGELVADAAHQAFEGRLQASSQVASIVDARARAHDATASLDMTRLVLTRAAGGVGVSGEGQGKLAVRTAERAGVTAAGLTSAVQITDLDVQAPTGGHAMVAATLAGDLGGHGSASAGQARRLSGQIPVLSGEDAYAAAIERGLRAFRFQARWRAELAGGDARFALTAPARIEAGSGARLTLADAGGGFKVTPSGARGGADLALQGGGLPSLSAQFRNASASASRFTADLAAQASLDALFAKGARLSVNGRLIRAGADVRFDLAGCTPVTAERLTFDPDPVTGFSGTICPSGGAIIEAGPRGWSVHGALRDARGDVAGLGADLREAAGRFEAAGGPDGLSSVRLTLDQGQAIDAADPVRFQPVKLEGQAGLDHGTWSGRFALTTRAAGHPIGTIRIRHDVASGAGRADIDAAALTFAPNGLQPAELTPMANFAKQAEGAAGFTGWFAWEADGKASSGGELIARDLRFKSPLGPVVDIASDTKFTSLSPLVTGPGQKITIAQVQAITPVTGLSVSFQLNPDSLGLEAARAAIAGGQVSLEPLVAPLQPGARITGALVLDHVDIGQVIATSSLADAVKLEAVVDGRVPFAIGPAGVTISQGSLRATGPGRITIARKALTGASAPGQVGFAQDLAYQAMEDLAFDQLDATMNTLPGDRLGVIFHIKGRHDPPQKRRATIAMSELLGGKALSKPITLPSDTQIDLTLDTSLNFGELIRALEQAVRDGLRQDPQPDRSAAVQAPSGEVATTK